MENKQKFTYDDIFNYITSLDLGCCYIGKGRYKKDKEIILDNDNRGNGNNGWLNIKYEKDKIKISRGSKLKKGEKKVWKFNDYENIDNLMSSLCGFTKKYFKSFVITRK